MYHLHRTRTTWNLQYSIYAMPVIWKNKILPGMIPNISGNAGVIRNCLSVNARLNKILI